MWTGRPSASTTDFCGVLLAALVSDASITWMWPGWQSRSGSPSCGSVWYQTIETLPASPAAIHGQNTRVPGCATAAGADPLFPRALVAADLIEVAPRGRPPGPPPRDPAGGDRVPAQVALDGVRAHVDLVRLGTREPGPVAVVAVCGSLVPRLAAVG